MRKFLAACAALLLLPMVGLAACTQVPGTDVKLVAPTVDGASVQQNVYAVLRAYADAAKEAATIVEDPATPAAVKTVLSTAVLNTAGPAKTVNDAFAAYDQKQGQIKAMIDAGQSVPAALFTEAGDLYNTAMKLYGDHKADLTSFPGIIKAVKAAPPADPAK
jgi:hypothetical protein